MTAELPDAGQGNVFSSGGLGQARRGQRQGNDRLRQRLGLFLGARLLQVTALPPLGSGFGTAMLPQRLWTRLSGVGLAARADNDTEGELSRAVHRPCQPGCWQQKAEKNPSPALCHVGNSRKTVRLVSSNLSGS